MVVVYVVREEGPSPRFPSSTMAITRYAKPSSSGACSSRTRYHDAPSTSPFIYAVPDDLSPAEQEIVANAQAWSVAEMAYAMEQSSKPQTLAFGLNDSPAGLGPWIGQKFHRWSDCDGDIETRFSKGELLTNLTIYWATETIGSSMRLYYETVRQLSDPGQQS